MMKVNTDANKPIKMWLDNLEEGALEQAKNMANLPFTYSHIAIMPDSHQGYGMPIGGVLATEGVVIPNAVGVDIGCGMCALQMPLKDISTEDLKKVMGLIRSRVPVGFKKHSEIQEGEFNREFGNLPVAEFHKENALKSLGTLGGGNHFIEIQKGDDGYIWIMIHSGSRNLGKQVCDFYNDKAKASNEFWYSKVEKDTDLAFIPMDCVLALDYINEMNFCVDFALANRKLMMKRIVESFKDVCGVIPTSKLINESHNYARMENHFGKNVMVHRKGATSAKVGEIGMIPGSQGTKSYIVRGLGNKDSFESCSHGAGRAMGRKQAQRELDFETEKKLLDDQGVLHAMRGKKDLDEAPGAYKDIHVVMDNQKDLCEILVELTPLAVIKG
jgi:tRNA-splicing ligase RtcB